MPRAAATKIAMNMYGGLDWICSKLLPFSIVEDPLSRKYSSLSPICRNTLTSYLQATTKEVENETSLELPDKFTLVNNGWYKGSTHLCAVFASYSCADKPYQSALLGFSPLLKENTFTAQDHFHYIEFLLSTYKNLENICVHHRR